MAFVVKIGVFFLIVAGLLVGGGIYLQKQMTPERVREYMLPLLESSLERKVELGKVEIGLLSGITVDDLKIKQRQKDTEDFISIGQVVLHYQLWPLLTGRFVINQVVLDSPVIAVSRFHDGSYNFSDLISANQRQRSFYREKSVAVANDLFSLLIKKVTIQDGSIVLLDAIDSGNTPYRYKFTQFNLNVRDFTFEEGFPFDVSTRFNDAQLDLSGQYDFSRHKGDLIVHLSPLDLIPFTPYYRDFFPGKLGAGRLGLNIEVAIEPDQFSSKGKVTLGELDLSVKRSVVKKADLSADYSIVFDHRTRRLSIATLMLSFDDIETTVDGFVDFTSKAPVVDLSIWLNKFDLREVMARLPEPLIRDYQKYSLAGTVNGRVSLQGGVDQPARLFRSARLNLGDVQISTEKLRLGLSGDVSYLNDKLKTNDLFLSYGNQVLQLSLDARKGDGGIFKGTFSIAADRFDCNEVIGAANVSQRSSVDPYNGQSEDAASFDLPLDLIGSMSANTIKYRNLVLDHAFADAQIHNNRLRLQNVRINLGNGRIKGESTLNLGVKGLAYSGDVQLNDVDLSELYQGLYPDGRFNPSGSLRLNTTFSGYGARKESLLKALNMQGSLHIDDGVVRGFPVLDSVARFIGGEELRGASFDTLQGQYQVANNIVNQASHIAGSRIRVSTQGNIDLDGYANLKLDARIAPKVLRRSGVVADVLASLTDDQGWGMIPLQVNGPMGGLKVGADREVIEQLMANKAKQELLDKLSEEAASGMPAQEGVQEMLDNTLNKLFGR